MPRLESHYGGYLIYGRGYGRDGTLVQTDWEYPATAQLFGWSLVRVQRRHDRILIFDRNPPRGHRCDHRSTDGTVDCPECGVRATDFIQAAGRFLDSIAE
jgi:hypothetical protein